jgi:hypothetical protein
MYFINVWTTLVKGDGSHFTVNGIRFETEARIDPWLVRFGELMDELNEELDLPNSSLNAIGYNFKKVDNPTHHPRVMRPWRPEHVVAEIKRHYEKFPAAIAA